MSSITLWLLRHAKVASHLGDQPLTPDALEPVAQAAAVIRGVLGSTDTVSFHSTQTKRSQETADALRDRILPEANSALPTWGLRNPDIYLFGSRVEMVSSADAFAGQITGMSANAADVLEQPFFNGFLSAPDRIEFWLHHKTPPGETASDVARRVKHFATSFAVRQSRHNHHAVCVTHSPVMRAVLTQWLGLDDPGEPDWVEAIQLRIKPDAVEALFRSKTVTL